MEMNKKNTARSFVRYICGCENISNIMDKIFDLPDFELESEATATDVETLCRNLKDQARFIDCNKCNRAPRAVRFDIRVSYLKTGSTK